MLYLKNMTKLYNFASDGTNYRLSGMADIEILKGFGN